MPKGTRKNWSNNIRKSELEYSQPFYTSAILDQQQHEQQKPDLSTASLLYPHLSSLRILKVWHRRSPSREYRKDFLSALLQTPTIPRCAVTRFTKILFVASIAFYIADIKKSRYLLCPVGKKRRFRELSLMHFEKIIFSSPLHLYIYIYISTPKLSTLYIDVVTYLAFAFDYRLDQFFRNSYVTKTNSDHSIKTNVISRSSGVRENSSQIRDLFFARCWLTNELVRKKRKTARGTRGQRHQAPLSLRSENGTLRDPSGSAAISANFPVHRASGSAGSLRAYRCPSEQSRRICRSVVVVEVLLLLHFLLLRLLLEPPLSSMHEEPNDRHRVAAEEEGRSSPLTLSLPQERVEYIFPS